MDIPNGFKDIKSFYVRHTPIIGAFCEKINLSSKWIEPLRPKWRLAREK